MRLPAKGIAVIFMLSASPMQSGLAENSQRHTLIENTGAHSWSVDKDGVHFSLTQILPEQGDAFYVNRGFDLEVIRPYTRSCVYMTVLRNDTASGPVHFKLIDWKLDSRDETRKLLPITHWLDRLRHKQASKAALVAFRWAQFPPEQTYQPGGDWNQGMLSVGLAPGQSFDITAVWDINGETYQSHLEGVQCAK